MIENTNKTVGEIVAEDYRTAQVFKNHKIDFCCKGNRSIQEVADKNSINLEELVKELKDATKTNSQKNIDFQSWPLDLLADHIEKKHHRYVEEKIPILLQYLHKLCSVHGERHPELFEIKDHFTKSAGELTAHMKKEELILFPAVRKMIAAKISGESIKKAQFETVKSPIEMMMQEHDNEGERFRIIDTITNGYTPPEDGCSTYQVAFSLLKEFEDDLHNHVHLENNILFPKAAELEKKMSFID